MGGGFDPQQQEQQEQRQEPQHVEHQAEPRPDAAHAIVSFIGEHIGYSPLLVLLLVGCGVIFKKKLRQFVKNLLK